MSWSPARSAAYDTICAYARSAELPYESGARDGELVLTLPGERKLRTVCSLVVGPRSLVAIAFVVRNPDERHDEVHRLLLQHNLRKPGVAYGIDDAGDIFVTARLPVEAVSQESVDELLGSLLVASDGIFNEVLARGFRTAMRREWQWRTSRGESTKNLEAFRSMLEEPPEESATGQ